jgi:hypothetical protein
LEEEKMFCTNCGASNKDNAKLCVNCSVSLSDVQIEGRLSRLRAINDVSSLHKIDFLHRLFDFSFDQLVSLRMMRFLYSLSIIFAGLMALFFIIVGFDASVWFGIFALLIGAPLIFLLTVVSSRVLLEMMLVIFRMADHMDNIGPANIKEKPESRDGIQWNV